MTRVWSCAGRRCPCRWTSGPPPHGTPDRNSDGRTAGPLTLSHSLTTSRNSHLTDTRQSHPTRGAPRPRREGQRSRHGHDTPRTRARRTALTALSRLRLRATDRTRLSPLASMAGVARRSRRCGRGLASADCPRAAPAPCRVHDSVLRGAPPAPPRARVGSHRRLAAHGCEV